MVKDFGQLEFAACARAKQKTVRKNNMFNILYDFMTGAIMEAMVQQQTSAGGAILPQSSYGHKTNGGALSNDRRR